MAPKWLTNNDIYHHAASYCFEDKTELFKIYIPETR
jgi:hypothetical protein